MKKQLKQLAIAFFIVIGVLSVVFTVPKVNALTVCFRDGDWTVIVTGPDMVKPGSVESYTVDGTLSLHGDPTFEGVDVYFYVETASELDPKLILEDTPSKYPGLWPQNYHFSKTYNITIPNDAINNTFVSVDIGSGYEYASGAASWVQDPTYSSLQDQISSLNSTIAILQSTYSGSASEIMSLQSLVLTLQSEKTNLQSEKANLQTQLNATQCSLDDANTKLSSSNYSMYGAFLTAIVFIIISVVLAVLLTKKRITVKEKGAQ